MSIIQRYNPVSGHFDLVNTSSGGTNPIWGYVANYSALPLGVTPSDPAIGDLVGANASQGIYWINYRANGFYKRIALTGVAATDYGTTPFASFSNAADQATVDAAAVGDQYVSPITMAGAAQFQYLDATSPIQAQFDNISSGNVSFPRRAGQWYCSAVNSFTCSVVAITKDVIRLTPFIVSEPTELDSIAMEISVAGSAGSLVQIGIWDSVDKYADTPIVDAGTIAGDSATNQTLAISTILQPGVYWLGYIHNSFANITFRSITFASGAIPNILGLKAGDFTGNVPNMIQMSYTYNGTLPVISGSTVTGLNLAIVAVKLAP